MATQLGRRRLASKVASACSVTRASCPPADTLGNRQLVCDSNFAPQSKGDCQGLQNTILPTIKPYAPENSSIVHDEPEKGFTVLSPTSQPPINRLATTKSAKLLHPPRSCSDGSFQFQQHAIIPDEAQKALQVVIGYCKQQPTGFLNLQEGVTLGKLDERLRQLRR